MKANHKRVSDLERRVRELEEVVYWVAAATVANFPEVDITVSPRAGGSAPKAGADLPERVVLAWASGQVASIGTDSSQADEDTPF